MLAAISAMKNGSKVKATAIEQGVPVSTLMDSITGKVIHGTDAGPKPYRTVNEEKESSLKNYDL